MQREQSNEPKGMVDISEPRHVEVRVRNDGKVVWINVDGTCVLRCCKIKKLEVVDERLPHHSD